MRERDYDGEKGERKVKMIPLTQGFVALVDDEDYDRLALYAWHARKSSDGGRVSASRNKVNGARRETVDMHREILGNPEEDVDHKSHWPLSSGVVDNRRENLRLVKPSQNLMNSRKRGGCSSAFKGVAARRARWRAYIRIEGKRICLGSFRVESHAALAYDLAAVKAFGEYALTNFAVPGSERWLF